MTKARKPAKRQADAFASVAKRLVWDSDLAKFDAKLGKIAKVKLRGAKSK